MKTYKFNEPIDLVYLWVDGNDPDWRASKNEWMQRLGITGENTDIDVRDIRYIEYNELKYSLRSVMKNVPWINRIFIVTNGQIPSWLDVENKKITMVKHEEIMPVEILPTFNSRAIEACLCNIPGLSEYFIYANDDMFINKPVTPDYFFDINGNPIVRLRIKHAKEKTVYFDSILTGAKLIKDRYNKNYSIFEPHHNIDAYRKSYFLECKQVFKSEFDKACHDKFRVSSPAQRNIISLYMLAVKKCKLKIILKTFWGKESLYESFVPDIEKIRKRINEYKPSLFCINDDGRSGNNNGCELETLLSEIFPERQVWEKQKIRQKEKHTMKRVITYGTFDILHYGHINLLKRAKALGDYLIVSLSSDEFNKIKNKKSYYTYEQRKMILEGCRYVDLVIPEDSWEQKRDDIVKYQADVFVMGDDWKGHFDFLSDLCEVVYLPRTPDVSTTKVKEQVMGK